MAGDECEVTEGLNDEVEDPDETERCFPLFVAEIFSDCIDLLYVYDRRQSLRGYDRSIHAYRSIILVNIEAGCGLAVVFVDLFANIYQSQSLDE